MPLGVQNNIYISNVSGGTGGAGGAGGTEGGGGGVGGGPSFQADTMKVVIQNDPEEREKIIKWASPLNFFPRQADIFGSRQPGTGDWFLQHRILKKWKAGEIPALWCRGIPGAGKTVLVSIVVDDLRRNLANLNIGVGVLYLDHKATAEAHSPRNLLAAIWQQLALEEPLSSDFLTLYKKHRAQGTHLSLEDTYSMLQCTASKFSQVFIFVDALDEYPEGNRNTLLRNLSKLGGPIRLMFTSRPHVNIDHLISSIETLDIQATEEDIRKYLEGQIQESCRLSRHIKKSPTLRESIEEKIVKRSDGMFLLAKLHIDSLMTKQNVAAVQNGLANLSSGLDDAYAGIVNRINQQSEDDRQLAWRTLSWVFNAKTPLRPSELREALSVEPEASVLDPDRQTDMDIISSVCAGLVVVNEADDRVRLIHYSTHTYLHSVQNTIFPHAQKEITLSCMTYMRLIFHKFPTQLLIARQPHVFTVNPFLHYAVDYCLVHARGKAETEIQDKILEFLENCSFWRILWNWKRWRDQLAPDRLCIAIAFRLEAISSHILRTHGPGSSLQEAASYGDTVAIRFLLKNVKNEGGAFVNAEGGKYGSALGAAVWNGHKLAVKLLIGHGANVNAGVGEYRNALHAAVWKGHDLVVQLLLQHGANIKANFAEYGALLKGALVQKNALTLTLLLDYGAGIDVKVAGELHKVLWSRRRATDSHAEGWELNSALQAASWMGHEGLVRLFLEHGADINAKGGLDASALQAASRQGNEVVVKLLLEHGAKVNAQGGLYGGALQAASSEGHAAVVKLLLAYGAHINPGDTRNVGALQSAARRGHICIVKLLLEHGADVNTGLMYSSALWEATTQGYGVIVKLLLEHQANINANNWLCGSTLQLGSRHGNEDIVKLLLTCGADVNMQGGQWGSALQEASGHGHKVLVKILLKHGADVNAQSRRCGSALQAASRQGHAGIVKLLLEHGADVDANGSMNGSPLQLASRQGHEVVVKLLLEYGADVNAKGSVHGSPLHLAARDGHEAVIKLLLTHGAVHRDLVFRKIIVDSDDESTSESESDPDPQNGE
ncbi:ankyrin repeat-containing domain protein [Mycena galopus ATCC 62051]|nr:ankyrin repeat-containing domain protein [Mycena galopus ATCC 62051]